jgi:hypothetical protein
VLRGFEGRTDLLRHDDPLTVSVPPSQDDGACDWIATDDGGAILTVKFAIGHPGPFLNLGDSGRGVAPYKGWPILPAGESISAPRL